MIKYESNEANFGRVLKREVIGGTHITLEIILVKDKKYYALRRDGIPGHKIEKENKGRLFFCHDLIRRGETIEMAVKRIVKSQAKVNVKDLRILSIESIIWKENDNWALIPHILAEVSRKPKKNKLVHEVVEFDLKSIPDDFAWWGKKDLKDFLHKYII